MVIVARIKNLLRELNRTSVDIIPRDIECGRDSAQNNRSLKKRKNNKKKNKTSENFHRHSSQVSHENYRRCITPESKSA